MSNQDKDTKWINEVFANTEIDHNMDETANAYIRKQMEIIKEIDATDYDDIDLLFDSMERITRKEKKEEVGNVSAAFTESVAEPEQENIPLTEAEALLKAIGVDNLDTQQGFEIVNISFDEVEEKPATYVNENEAIVNEENITSEVAGKENAPIFETKRKMKSKQIDSEKDYNKRHKKLSIELVNLQQWVKQKGLKVAIILEGRDSAGKGGAIKSFTQELNPRECRIVALDKPTERELSQWYFQRYVAQLPSKGEIVLFDRSWYNRSGVEKVMGFCSELEYREFMSNCPEFEHMLVKSGVILLKYWFDISRETQYKRLKERAEEPEKRWKLGSIDLASLEKWNEYSLALDAIFAETDSSFAPWHVVKSDNKYLARLNFIAHVLEQIPYEHAELPELEVPNVKDNPLYEHIQPFNYIDEPYTGSIESD